MVYSLNDSVNGMGVLHMDKEEILKPTFGDRDSCECSDVKLNIQIEIIQKMVL